MRAPKASIVIPTFQERRDRTLWYASEGPEGLLARPWREPECTEEFRMKSCSIMLEAKGSSER